MSVSSLPSKTPLLSNAVYNALKHIAAVVLPASNALYFALAQVWHFPNIEQVMATLAAVNTFVGVFVGVSNLSYNKSDGKYVGAIEVTDDGSKKTYSLNLNSAPEDLEKMQEATFKVNPVQSVSPPV